jgi:hypothetical protein
MKNIVRVQFGSHLYGTNTPLSDLDYKSVHIPSCSDIVMQTVADSYKQPARRKVEGEHNNPDDVDDESFALHRFFELCVKGETLALDMLFAPEESRLKSSPIWTEIVNNRHRLISKRSSAFVGYCRTQANKYGIKGSRVKEAQVAYEFFSALEREYGTTSKVGDHIGALERIITGSIHTGLYPVDEMQKPVESPTHFECCDKQVPLQSSVKVAREIYERVYNGYGDRAKKAQDNEGIDWKALSHAIRVGDEAIELLTQHKITFPLLNREYVRSVKLGNRPFKEVAECIEALLIRVEEASAKSDLPDKPDTGWINDFVYKHYRNEVISTARWGAY